MLKLLIAVDDSESALRAVRHVIELARRGVAVEAVLLNVQPPVMSGEVGAVAPVEIALQARATASAEALGAAKRPLDDAGVPATARAATGDAAEAIVAAAAELGCDGIVIGRRGRSALAGLVLGSVSARVVGLARLPVTLVQ
jgi:nucleotide-binding universal stress UspA family protein